MAYGKHLAERIRREMDFTKRPMKGFVYVDPEGRPRYKTTSLLTWVLPSN